jgi:hypothetical protein
MSWWGRLSRGPRIREAVLVLSALGLLAAIARLLPRGWPAGVAAGTVIVLALCLAVRVHGVGKAVSGFLAVLGAALVIAGGVGEFTHLQNLIKGTPGAPPSFILKPTGSASKTASRAGISLVRACPHVRCRVKGRLADDTPVVMLCWTDTEPASDRYRSPRWFRIQFKLPRTVTSTGYIHSSDVVGQASTPRCR